MSRFFKSRKKPEEHITSAERYYRNKYGEDKEDAPSDRENVIMQKLIELGVDKIKKTSGYLTKYTFDFPFEHEDDITQRIPRVAERDKDVHIDAELIQEFPIFFHVTVREETKRMEFDSLSGMSIVNFVNLKTNNDKLALKILNDTYVSEYFLRILKDIMLISTNKGTLSAKLTSINQLEIFFKLIARMVKIAEKG